MILVYSWHLTRPAKKEPSLSMCFLCLGFNGRCGLRVCVVPKPADSKVIHWLNGGERALLTLLLIRQSAEHGAVKPWDRMSFPHLGGPQEKMSFFQIASGPILSIPIHSKTCLYGPSKFFLKKMTPSLPMNPPKSAFFYLSPLTKLHAFRAHFSKITEHPHGSF